MNTKSEFIKNAFYYGLYMAGAFILIDLFNYVFNMSDMGMLFGLLIFLVILALYFVFYIWGGRSYRNKYNDGYIKYGPAFLFCLLMALTYVLVMFLYHILFYYFFDPERVFTETQKAVEMIEQNSFIPDDKKDDIVASMLEKATATKIVFQGLLNNSIMGIIISSLAALFIRKKEKISEVF